MPDSQDIDTALLTKLSSDATLLSYVPNGVYFDEAPPNSTQFVIISLVDEADDAIFGGRKFEDGHYLIKAVARTTAINAASNVRSAAARIDALLEDTTLTVSGYTTFEVSRESRIRITEVDDADPTIRWYHRGGQYRVQMTLT